MPGERRLPEGLGGVPASLSDRGVHRPTGPWTPTVHAYLRHLEHAGFDGAPRVAGTDDAGREILTFIEGDVLAAGRAWEPGDPTPWPAWARSEECLVATARLLRALHDVAATFVPPQEAVWRRYSAPVLGADEIVCHGDIGPHNTVYRHGLPVAFIDWDTIRPNHPMVEFGIAAWKYVPLGDDAHFETSDFGKRPALDRRLALFARAYGVQDRVEVRWALQQAKQRSVEATRYFPVTPARAAAATRRQRAGVARRRDRRARRRARLRAARAPLPQRKPQIAAPGAGSRASSSRPAAGIDRTEGSGSRCRRSALAALRGRCDAPALDVCHHRRVTDGSPLTPTARASVCLSRNVRPVPRTDSASRVVAATPEHVYAAFTDPDALAAWLAPEGMTAEFERFDPRPGGSYRLVLTDIGAAGSPGKTTASSNVVEARFVDLVPGVRVVQEVDFESDDPSFAGTMTMTWEATVVDGRTRVDFTADDVPEGISAEDHVAGLGSSVANLSAYVEE